MPRRLFDLWPRPVRKSIWRPPRPSGADVSGARREDAGNIVAERVIYFMQRLNIPNGLERHRIYPGGYPARLVEGTLPQHRVVKLSPRPASAEELADIFNDAMRYW